MRLFSPTPLRATHRYTLDDEQSRYLRLALRLRVGDTVTLFDGSGGEYIATILLIGKSRVDVETGEFVNRCLESPLPLRLVQGISKGDRMDTVVQKATELGVQRISPVLTERSVTKLDGKRALKRHEHWQKVAQSACEQCGRNIIPTIDEVMSLNEWHDANPYAIDEVMSLNDWHDANPPGQSTRLILQPHASSTLSSISLPAGKLTLLIGPEGGFSDIEYERAAISEFILISLGPRILRTETAAIATIAAVQALWGDLQS